MAVKIITEDQSFKPVKIEITFETIEQLKSFVLLYGHPALVSSNAPLAGVTEKGIDSLMTSDEWESLRAIMD